MLSINRTIPFVLLVGGVLWVTTTWAEPLKIGMLLSNPQQLRITFPLVGSEKHFSVIVKREGEVAKGSTWAGAKVQEVGYHDVSPGDRVWGTGYITFTLPNGDQVSMKHEFKASFLPGESGKMRPVDHGTWTITAGTGTLAGIRGVGRFQFKRSPDDQKARVWDLTGDIGFVKK